MTKFSVSTRYYKFDKLPGFTLRNLVSLLPILEGDARCGLSRSAEETNILFHHVKNEREAVSICKFLIAFNAITTQIALCSNTVADGAGKATSTFPDTQTIYMIDSKGRLATRDD